MVNLFLGLGGNIGNVSENFKISLEKIDKNIGRIIAKSSMYKTEPWGNKNQEFFLNQVIEVETALSADDVLQRILKIEILLGRNRDKDNQFAARTIDIDILFFGDEIINRPNLIVPHPRLHLRNFVLTPLLEIAPEFLHPSLGKKIKDLIKDNPDNSEVTLFE
ncbi:MAG: 2-amino-4-hydroxy-6-hydroxymethyldihydropteridine diphosphokinase [Bacteroidota bacterium]|nr:2-amino-4-hydroxy-6-hydroxymethyldihydropteridine diphosphokinase [Bacteroidota bacterium]